MKEYNRARVYLDENYKSQEHFTVSAVPSPGLGARACWSRGLLPPTWGLGGQPATGTRQPRLDQTAAEVGGGGHQTPGEAAQPGEAGAGVWQEHCWTVASDWLLV